MRLERGLIPRDFAEVTSSAGEIMTIQEASKRKYTPLTSAYNQMPEERQMLENVINGMKCGNIDYALIETDGGTEVWRRKAKS